jgi:hypothetical protein
MLKSSSTQSHMGRMGLAKCELPFRLDLPNVDLPRDGDGRRRRRGRTEPLSRQCLHVARLHQPPERPTRPPQWSGGGKNRMRMGLKATPPHQMGTVLMDPRKQLICSLVQSINARIPPAQVRVIYRAFAQVYLSNTPMFAQSYPIYALTNLYTCYYSNCGLYILSLSTLHGRA